jgi:carlactone C-19 oxidase
MMQSYIERVVQSVSKVSAEEDVPFSELSLKLATDIIGQAAFGIDFALTKENSNYNINMDKECQSFIKEHIYSTTSLKMDLSGSFSTILGLIMPFYKVHLGKYWKEYHTAETGKLTKRTWELTERLNEIVAKRMNEENRESSHFLSSILNARQMNESARNLFTPDYINALALSTS